MSVEDSKPAADIFYELSIMRGKASACDICLPGRCLILKLNKPNFSIHLAT